MRICLTCSRTGTEDLIALPVFPPRVQKGITCMLCTNSCQIAEGGIGYYGTRAVARDKARGGTKEAHADCCYDSVPANCMADQAFPGGTGIGYPHYVWRQELEHRYKYMKHSHEHMHRIDLHIRSPRRTWFV
jgi:pyruvate formate lyase activating enzyme